MPIMPELLIPFLLGIAAGTFTGLMPGIHVNNVATWVLMLGMSIQGLEPVKLVVFLLSAAITHSFVDFIPSIFFAAPSEDTALSVLPGHRFLLRGYGLEAVMLTAYSGVFALALTLAMIPVLVRIVPMLYESVKGILGYVLLMVVVLMLAIEKNKLKAVLVVLLSSILGMSAFTLKLSTTEMFSALLTGLFGMSVMVVSYTSKPAKLPGQRDVEKIEMKKLTYGTLLGVLGGVLAGVLPAIGSSQSAIVMTRLSRIESKRVFISAIGAINTITAILSVVSIYLIGHARSGVAVAISQIIRISSLSQVLFLSTLALAAGCIAALITIKISRTICTRIDKVQARKAIAFMMAFLIMFTNYFAGLTGTFLLITSTFLGILPHIWQVKKSLLMSSLMVPTALIYLSM